MTLIPRQSFFTPEGKPMTKQDYVLQRLAEGATRKQISVEMGRTPSDVGTIISRLKQKGVRIPEETINSARMKAGRQYGSRGRVAIYLDERAFDYFGKIAQERKMQFATAIRIVCETVAKDRMWEAVVDDDLEEAA